MPTASLRRTTCARIPTGFGQFQLCHFLDTLTQKEHLALIFGEVAGKRGVLTRVHSECFTGDVLGSLRCDCGEQLQTAMQVIARAGSGVILYLRQEGRGIGLEHKLRAYNLQDQGYDTVDANLMLGHQADEREYSAAAAMLKELGIESLQLLTNNPDKIESLQQLGIVVEARVPLQPSVHRENAEYLATKVQRMRHLLTLEAIPTLGSAVTSVPAAAVTVNSAMDTLQLSPPAPAVRVDNSGHDSPSEIASRISEQIIHLTALADVHQKTHTRPFVTLTYAQTLDGSIASNGGRPLRISGPEAMRMTHQLRTCHDAILVGIGTVLSDDPRLTARLVEGSQPQPVVLDTHLRMPPDASLFQHPRGLWIATHLNGNQESGRERLADSAPRLVDIPLNHEGRLDLEALLNRLGEMGIRRLMVEGGSSVIHSFLRARLVDYLVITIAPRFAAGQNVLAPSVSGDAVHADTSSGWPSLHPLQIMNAGEDLLLWGQPRWENPVNANSYLGNPEPLSAQPT